MLQVTVGQLDPYHNVVVGAIPVWLKYSLISNYYLGHMLEAFPAAIGCTGLFFPHLLHAADGVSASCMGAT